MSNIITCIDLSKPRKYVSNFVNDRIIDYKLLPQHNKDTFKTFVKVTQTALVITIAFPTPVSAAPLNIGDKIVTALNPLVDAIQALGYPLAMISMAGGAITMMFNKKLGVRIIKDTIIAFLVLQFLPGLMGILVEIGRALRG